MDPVKFDTVKFFRYFGYTVSVIFLVSGVLIIAGLVIPTTLPPQFRIMLGVVVVLYGVFRFIRVQVSKNRNTGGII
jgi:hypothetical protein